MTRLRIEMAVAYEEKDGDKFGHVREGEMLVRRMLEMAGRCVD